MARVIGGLGTSHVPAIGGAIARGAQHEPYWSPFFDGFVPVCDWLKSVRPDVAVIFYNDHGLNFFLDKMPTFAIGAAPEYRNADEGWGLATVAPYLGDAALSWHLINALVEREFDIASCQDMLVDHAVTIPLSLMWGSESPWIRIVPIAINTVQHPLPSPARCFKLGQAVGLALAGYEEDAKVVVVGSGGLSHQLDGARAGFINRKFDLYCMQQLVDDPETLTEYSALDLVDLAGSQGVELLNWIAMRGALPGAVRKLHANYHVPISNTATGVLLLENASPD